MKCNTSIMTGIEKDTRETLNTTVNKYKSFKSFLTSTL